MRRRAYLAAIGVSTALGGCLNASGSDGGDYDVGMSTSRFQPATLSVAPGTTVRWQNTSKSSHTVTAYEDAIPAEAAYFASGGHDSEAAARATWDEQRGGALEPGDGYEHTFTVPGTYQYVCIPHEPAGMIGTIEVAEDATRTPRDA